MPTHTRTLLMQAIVKDFTVWVSAFVYFVDFNESTSVRDDNKSIQAHYWLPLGDLARYTPWLASRLDSQPKYVTLLLGWSHSRLLPVSVPRDVHEESRASSPVSPPTNGPHLPTLWCGEISQWTLEAWMTLWRLDLEKHNNNTEMQFMIKQRSMMIYEDCWCK